MSVTLWTEEEINFLKQNTSMSIQNISNILKRTQVSIKYKIRELKIKRNQIKRKKKFLNDKEIYFLKENYSNLSNDEIATHLDISISSVLYYAKKFKLNKPKKNFIKYFDIDCSPEYSYVLGWLFSDGTINIDKGIAVTIKQEDAENIKEYMMNIYDWNIYDFKSKQYPSNKYLTFRCNSRIVAKFLADKWGLDKKSSFMSEELCNYIKSGGDNCIRSFLRGLFDGDGCIDKYRPYIRITANINFDWTNIIKLLPINLQYKIVRQSNKTSISILQFHKDGFLFCKYIYGGLFSGCLQRKKNRFLNLNNLYYINQYSYD